MRGNKVSRVDRLQQRVWTLIDREDKCWTRKKFYPTCKHCGITNVYKSIEGDHRKHCPLRGLDKMIAHYTHLLEEAKKENKT